MGHEIQSTDWYGVHYVTYEEEYTTKEETYVKQEEENIEDWQTDRSLTQIYTQTVNGNHIEMEIELSHTFYVDNRSASDAVLVGRSLRWKKKTDRKPVYSAFQDHYGQEWESKGRSERRYSV